jgi:(4S)-4-hydroxy-5-phosphonooxypentane-2,3-dione isomerase
LSRVHSWDPILEVEIKLVKVNHNPRLEKNMHIVLVHVHVKPEYIEEFKAATLNNARNSMQEAGVIRFDFLQQAEDPTRFTLIEVYKSPQDQLLHRETRHYQVWRDTVPDMMAEQRVGIKYANLFPEDPDWHK